MMEQEPEQTFIIQNRTPSPHYVSDIKLSFDPLQVIDLTWEDPKLVKASKDLKNSLRKGILVQISSDAWDSILSREAEREKAINQEIAKIEKENKEVIIYYNPNINEGLIGIIAARLKDYFNKPSIVITASNELLKGSARSVYNYNIGRVIKNSLDQEIILNGGGHNMAAGFTLNINNPNFNYSNKSLSRRI